MRNIAKENEEHIDKKVTPQEGNSGWVQTSGSIFNR